VAAWNLFHIQATLWDSQRYCQYNSGPAKNPIATLPEDLSLSEYRVGSKNINADLCNAVKITGSLWAALAEDNFCKVIRRFPVAMYS
jgi:hypothetical protein